MWKLHRRTTTGSLAAAAIAIAAAATAAPPMPPSLAPPARAQAEQSLVGGLPPASLGGRCLPSGKAFLRATIRGAVRLDVDLHGAELRCAGEPRLDGSGIRMGFEGVVRRVGRVRMIFGIDGAREGQPGRELPTNLTVIFEDEKLLFATQGSGNCTVDRLTQQPVNRAHAATRPRGSAATPRAPSTGSKTHTFEIVAHGFCIAPANDLGGRRRIMVTTFDFAGRADFNTP